MIRREIVHYYWRAQAKEKNIGDCVTHVLLRTMGFDVVATESRFPADVFRGVGTLPSPECVTGVVWGAGYSGAPVDAATLNARIFAVRGPLTRFSLGLPDWTPLGDPALLLPRLFPFPAAFAKPIFVPHVHNAEKPIPPDFPRVVSVSIADVHGSFFERLAEIVSSRFVLTNSLHAAIFAQAYRVPWALCLPPGHTLDMPAKWDDWFAYLALPRVVVNDLREAEVWWETWGRHGRTRDLLPLVQAFPYPIPNQLTLRLLAGL